MKQYRIAALALALALPALLSDVCEAGSRNVFPGVTQTQESRSAVRAKFGELPKELQENARRLGYKENSWVEMQQDSSGAFTLLPPKEDGRTPEEMKAKLEAVLRGRILKKAIGVNVEAQLATDGTGHFTIREKFDSLMDPVQEDAEAQGYKSGDEVSVQIDAVTWAHKVVRKEKPLWSGHLQKVIPPKDPNGRPSYIVLVSFEKLPESLQDKAEDLGYKKGDAVRILYDGDSKESDVLRPQFRLGVSFAFDGLPFYEQNEARDLGYTAGKTVWKKFGKNLLTLEIVPASEAGDGPLLIVDYKFIMLKDGNIALDCSGRFENLDALAQLDAVNAGYTEGDTVRMRYFVKAKTFKALPRK